MITCQGQRCVSGLGGAGEIVCEQALGHSFLKHSAFFFCVEGRSSSRTNVSGLLFPMLRVLLMEHMHLNIDNPFLHDLCSSHGEARPVALGITDVAYDNKLSRVVQNVRRAK
jgi:hypothetical protein